MIRLYVGVRSGTRRRLLVACRHGGSITYELCWEGQTADLEKLAGAMLARHLADGARAQAMCASFPRLLRARLGSDFWTLRPGEIDEVIARLA